MPDSENASILNVDSVLYLRIVDAAKNRGTAGMTLLQNDIRFCIQIERKYIGFVEITRTTDRDLPIPWSQLCYSTHRLLAVALVFIGQMVYHNLKGD